MRAGCSQLHETWNRQVDRAGDLLAFSDRRIGMYLVAFMQHANWASFTFARSFIEGNRLATLRDHSALAGLRRYFSDDKYDE
jgi:hypothetical protein